MRVYVHIICQFEHLSESVWVREAHTSVHTLTGYREPYRALREGMGECVLPATAINYKALGLHVLIRGINVSSFPPHTLPFASINAE